MMRCLLLSLSLAAVAACSGEEAPKPPENKPILPAQPELVRPTVGAPLLEDIPVSHKSLPIGSEGDTPPSFFDSVLSAQCRAAYETQSLEALRSYAESQKASGVVSCFPGGSCENKVDNLAASPLRSRSLSFGGQTGELEQAVLSRVEQAVKDVLPGASLSLSEGTIVLRWQDVSSNSQAERELRDTYKVMELMAGLSLRWQPCSGASGAACGVLPQVAWELLALTPSAGSSQGAGCTLYLGVPDELRAKGLSGPSKTMRQLKVAALGAIQAELTALGSCGDNSVQNRFEACDDGNTQSGDGCSASCQAEAP